MRIPAPVRYLLLLALFLPLIPAQPQVTSANWGGVTAPVYGTSQGGTYGGAELFAGPNQFGSYYSGVLPNGKTVNPAGVAFVQVGMNPVASALTQDEQFLVVANSSERQPSYVSYRNSNNTGGYSLSVIYTGSFSVISELKTAGTLYNSLIITGFGPYTVYASGGGDNTVKTFTLSQNGILTPAAQIPILPMLPVSPGSAANYSPALSSALFAAHGYLPSGAAMTFPAGMQLSPDGRYLYVACNLDNSIAVIDVYSNAVVNQSAAGYFPYGVAVSYDGSHVYATNWGVTGYQFGNAAHTASPGNLPDGFYVPKTSTTASSSISQFNAPGRNGYNLVAAGAIPAGPPLDDLNEVGGTHPSAILTVRHVVTGVEMLYYTKSNSDGLGIVRLDQFTVLPDFDLSPLSIVNPDGHAVHGGYPSAMAVSPDANTLYVVESGINSVAVLDISRPLSPPVLLGRIPTAWYPTSITITPDGQFLFITNAKGVGPDINPQAGATNLGPTGPAADMSSDSNSIFGMVQLVYLPQTALNNTTVLSNNYTINPPVDTSIIPGGGRASSLIKHVFVIVHENKSFDSVLGGLASRFGAYSSQKFQNPSGYPYFNAQFASVMPNTQTLAASFATAVNFYSDAEESNAGAQFLASGTATDYTERTLLNAGGRGLLANRNAEPEDYPEGGYIFNNAARNGVTFKDYGFLTTLAGSDNGTNLQTRFDDPASGQLGYPQLQADNATVSSPLANAGDVTSPVRGLGQQYYLALPGLAVLGEKNPTGEPRLDPNYPGVNFNISDQRRALEFIADFDRMSAAGTVPQLIYIYQPNDATGITQAPNANSVTTATELQQVADGDAALGMVVSHIMSSPLYYNSDTGFGSAIFVTYTSSQATVDHIHPHRSLLVAISPYAKTSYIANRHYSSASVVKTAELLLGLPPNNLGDLMATDLRDMFQSGYNGVAPANLSIARPSVTQRRVTIEH